MKLHPSAYVIALGAIALHLAFNHRYGYYRDEFYFIDCARHLAWGYVDQPPLAPLVAWATSPLEYSVWALRFVPAILAGIVALFACAIARELRGNGFAQAMTAITVTLAPGLMGLAYGLSTEFCSPAFWTALIYLTIRLAKTGSSRLYVPIALVVTVGLYAKYSIAACAVALAIALLLTRRGPLLQSKWLALSAAVVVVLTLPNTLWQFQHGLPILQVIHNDQLNRHARANGIADESAQRWVNAAYMLTTSNANNSRYATVMKRVSSAAVSRDGSRFHNEINPQIQIGAKNGF